LKLLVTTGFGNVIQGGADIWVNHFIDLILPQLSDDYFIFVDGRRPEGFETSLTNYHFHYDDWIKSEKLLEDCEEIHFLHANYHKRQHLWKHKDKWGNIFVHAYLPDMLKYGDSVKQFNTNINEDDFYELLHYCKKRIWIGNNDSQLFKDYPTNTHTVTNFYEFKQDKLINVNSKKVAFTSRIESRKNVHYLDGIEGLVLSNQYDWKNITETTDYDFSKIKFYQWDINIHENFMNLDWGISHCCHTNEPFGYNIFQAVDWGKLPIIHTDWGDVDYRYKANDKQSFGYAYGNILRDTPMQRTKEFIKLKKYLKKFDNKETWTKKIIVFFNS